MSSSNSNENIYKFENLAFEGGGVLGYAYVGVVQVLEEKKILQRCQRFSGASAGAMTAGLLALRASADILAQALDSLDANAVVDSSYLPLQNLNRFWYYGGWAKGQHLEKWYGDMIAKFCDRHITLLQVYNKFGTSVVITGTCLNSGTTEYFTKDTHPTMSLAQAVRISAGYPCIFPMVEFQHMQWWDGGIGDNYPVHVFDTTEPTVVGENDQDCALIPQKNVFDRIPNFKTLGFKLVSSKTDSKTAATRQHNAPPVAINNVYDALKRVATMVLDMSRQLHVHELDWKRSVLIDVGSLKATDFDIQQAEKNFLIANGRKATEDFLAKIE